MKSFVETSANAAKEMLAGMPAKSETGNVIAHYELYKSVNHLDGCIVNCGIASEDAFTSFAILRSMMAPKKLIAFEKHTKNLYFDNTIMPYGSLCYETKPVDTNTSLIQLRLLQSNLATNHEFIPDYIADAIPQYLIENPELKIAFLTINLDDYDATLTALQFFFPRLVQDGKLVFENFYKQEEDYHAICDYFHYESIEINNDFDNKGIHYVVKK